jgi:uncharacterized protein YybS (DUF2232 family)
MQDGNLVWVVLNSEGKGLINRNFLTGIVISPLLFIFPAAFPQLASFSFFLLPLPILFYYSKLGRTLGIVIVLVTLVVAVFAVETLGRTGFVPLLCLLGFLGVVLAEVLRRKLSIEKAILSSIVALILPVLVLIAFSILHTGEAPWQSGEAYLANAILENVKTYSEMGFPPEQINQIKDNAKKIAATLINILPALVLVNVAFCIWLNLLAARTIFYRQRLYFPDFGDLARWKSPEKLIWLVIVSGGMLLIPDDRVFYAALNILILCLFVYLLQGLAIISFLFRKKNIPIILRTVFYVLLTFQPIFTLLVIAVGLFDLWLDFRKFNATMDGSAA